MPLNKIQKQMLDDQFLNEIGETSNLQTQNKGSLVEAVNETVSQLAQRATKEELATKRDKSTPLMMVDLHTEVKTAMTGGSVAVVGVDAVGAENIKKDAVTPEKVSFMHIGKNLFNPANVFPDQMVDYNTGILAANVQHLATDFIEVLPNETYVINKDSNIAFYDSTKTYISGLVKLLGQSFTTPSNTAYIRASVKRYDLEPNIAETTQIEKGSVVTEYIPYINGIGAENIQPLETKNIKNRAVTINKCDFFTPSKNLYDKSKATDNFLVDGNTGNLLSNTSHSASDYIEVTGDTTYIINKKYNIAFYDINKVFISGANSNMSTPFTTPSNCKYVRFSLADFGTIPNIKDLTQLEKGNVSTPYVPFEVRGLDSSKIDISSMKAEEKFTTLKWNSLGDSITEANKYQGFVNGKLRFNLVRNYGIGGTTIADTTGSVTNAFVNRYSSMDNDADIISVMGGTNDWGQNVIISNQSDPYDKSTLQGAIRTIIEGLIAKYPGKYIVWATLPQRNNVTYPDGVNANGNTTHDYAEAIKSVCKEYAIPCIDVHNESGINKFNMDTNGSLMPDRVHPSDVGHKRIASLFIDMINKIVY